MLSEQRKFYKRPVLDFIRTDAPLLGEDTTVTKALNFIRTLSIADQIAYFYVVDNDFHLVGVVPLRRLITSQENQEVKDIMIKGVVSLSGNATLGDARHAFSLHKFLSLPVLDEDQRFLGVLDVTVLTGKAVDFSVNHRFDEIFETIGIRFSMIKFKNPFTAFLLRFPWLITTILSGLACALLSSVFQKTIEESIILAFFLTLVLGLGESVSIQSLTITVRQLHQKEPTFSWYANALFKEILVALFLGAACGIIVGSFIFVWKHDIIAALVIGLSIVLSIMTACVMGLSAPVIIHALKLDPKVAAGPLALGLSDICTLLFYFGLGTALL